MEIKTILITKEQGLGVERPYTEDPEMQYSPEELAKIAGDYQQSIETQAAPVSEATPPVVEPEPVNQEFAAPAVAPETQPMMDSVPAAPASEVPGATANQNYVQAMIELDNQTLQFNSEIARQREAIYHEMINSNTMTTAAAPVSEATAPVAEPQTVNQEFAAPAVAPETQPMMDPVSASPVVDPLQVAPPVPTEPVLDAGPPEAPAVTMEPAMAPPIEPGLIPPNTDIIEVPVPPSPANNAPPADTPVAPFGETPAEIPPQEDLMAPPPEQPGMAPQQEGMALAKIAA